MKHRSAARLLCQPQLRQSPIAGTAKRSSTISSPPRSRLPMCRWSSAPAASGRRTTRSTCRSRCRPGLLGAGRREGHRWCRSTSRARSATSRAGPCRQHQRNARSAVRRRRDARRPAGLYSVGRDAAAGPLLGEDRRCARTPAAPSVRSKRPSSCRSCATMRLKVSSVVMSTQVQKTAAARKSRQPARA